jgi:hypothetical protein
VHPLTDPIVDISFIFKVRESRRAFCNVNINEKDKYFKTGFELD